MPRRPPIAMIPLDPTIHRLLTPARRPDGRVVGRYAPSPTGDLHLGNLRTALAAWADCRRRGGIFILRIEDLDAPRTIAGAEARLLDDLCWLGMDWDEGPDVGGPAGPYRQSERRAIYGAALAALTATGLTYFCTCSRKVLKEQALRAGFGRSERLVGEDADGEDAAGEGTADAGPEDGAASAPHRPDGIVYPGLCRNRPAALQKAHPAGASVRFRVDGDPVIEFDDLCLGRRRYDLRSLCGDFIIRRRDGLWAYQLACAVDDALMGVTHVLRGEDLVTSTPRQIALMRALAAATGRGGLSDVPTYGHLPLVLDETGRRMCKRDGSCSLRALREAGLTQTQARGLIERLPLTRPASLPA
ncbi:MAG: tRNA glutamyl-Q(34) synthetase GluQRS [bacterium]|nr:tRNA glutamyl-Q(34) synthetase GluQRS [bacterium]